MPDNLHDAILAKLEELRTWPRDPRVLLLIDLASAYVRQRLDVSNLLTILDAQILMSECDLDDEDRTIVEQIRADNRPALLAEVAEKLGIGGKG